MRPPKVSTVVADDDDDDDDDVDAYESRRMRIMTTMIRPKSDGRERKSI